jgi:Fe-S cluster assembly ATP-binding protein
LSFQQPVEIPGVANLYFLRTALNAGRRARGEEEVGPVEFLGRIEEQLRLVEMDRELLGRSVNEGFSGGEKKRNEILQLAVLSPRLAILDEIDSGLDIDALRIVGKALQSLRTPERAFLVITHHERLLDEIVPDVVHVLEAGTITRSGDASLAGELEAQGYGDAAAHSISGVGA